MIAGGRRRPMSSMAGAGAGSPAARDQRPARRDAERIGRGGVAPRRRHCRECSAPRARSDRRARARLARSARPTRSRRRPRVARPGGGAGPVTSAAALSPSALSAVHPSRTASRSARTSVCSCGGRRRRLCASTTGGSAARLDRAGARLGGRALRGWYGSVSKPRQLRGRLGRKRVAACKARERVQLEAARAADHDRVEHDVMPQQFLQRCRPSPRSWRRPRPSAR